MEIRNVEGEQYTKDGKGRLVKLEDVPALDMLRDETIENCIAEMQKLNEMNKQVKARVMELLGNFINLSAQEYGVTIKKGEQGAVTLTSFDGCRRVRVTVADIIVCDERILAAKELIDECLTKWSVDSNQQLRILVNQSFAVNEKNMISVSKILDLLRAGKAIGDDEQWNKAMKALRESLVVQSKKEYITAHIRSTPNSEWQAVDTRFTSA